MLVEAVRPASGHVQPGQFPRVRVGYSLSYILIHDSKRWIYTHHVEAWSVFVV